MPFDGIDPFARIPPEPSRKQQILAALLLAGMVGWCAVFWIAMWRLVAWAL